MAERTEAQRTETQRTQADDAAGPRTEAERSAREFSAQTGYRASANQAREEPVPASHHEDHDQAAVLRNEDLGQGHRPDGEPAEARGQAAGGEGDDG
jgi:hypothetical protein